MTSLVNFPVYKLNPDGQARNFGPELPASQFLEFWDFIELAGISVNSRYATRETSQFTTVSCDPDHPRLSEAVHRLEGYGWFPYYGFTPPNLRRNHYTLRIARRWDEADLNSAALLRFCGWGSTEGNFAGFTAYRDDACVATVVLKAELQNSWDGPFVEMGSVCNT